jgi:hypothetical protein
VASYPRGARWIETIQAFVALLDTDPERLAASLPRLGVRP